MFNKTFFKYNIKTRFIIILLIIVTMGFPPIVEAKTYPSRINQEVIPYSDKINNYPGYASLVNDLKLEYPNWNFTFLYTGLDWEDVIYAQTKGNHSRSLLNHNNSNEWLCQDCINITYDNGTWKGASEEAVKYYMDPRNWLNEYYIFQFEDLSFNGNIQSINGVNVILSGTFMAGNKITYKKTDGTIGTINKSYAQVIMDSAQAAGISPYHLAARIRQEVGTNGSSTSKGEIEGFIGYYNFLNIKATGGSTSQIITNALNHAKSMGWDDPEKAIIGGAEFLGKDYIRPGQSTPYLQKFDVRFSITDLSDRTLYTHQYMQSLTAAIQEGTKIRESYKNLGIINSSINFVIPVYENMPQASPYQLAKIKCITTVNLREHPNTNSKVIHSLVNGKMVNVIQKNAATSNGYVWDKVVITDGKVGYVCSDYLTEVKSFDSPAVNTGINNNYKFENNILMCEPNTTTGRVKEGNSSIIIKSGGTVLSNDVLISTGNIVEEDGATYSVVKLGDVSGDGIVDARDALRILKYSVGTYDISGNNAIAADINKDGIIDARDSLRILKYSVGTYLINL